MALYDEIINTFTDSKTYEVLKLYCNNRSLYSSLVKDKNFDNNTAINYRNNFLKHIQNPTISTLYKTLLGYNYIEIDKRIEKYINEVKNRNDLTDIQKDMAIANIKENWIYPLSKYKSIFEKYSSYEEILVSLDKLDYKNVTRDLDNLKLYPHNQEIIQETKENIKRNTNISDNELNDLLLLYEFKNKLRLKFFGGEGIMGYHVNISNLDPNKECKQKSDIKFYINAGTDTFEFARYFQSKCLKENIDFKYKVVDSLRYKEYERTDRMCIWSSYEDAERIVNILKEIKEEHPEFNYQNPPILCGTIDNFIGVGQDFDSSFNDSMSTIIEKSIKNIFHTADKQKILKIAEENPSIIPALRNEITKMAKSKGLDPTKMCVKNDIKKKLPRYLKTTNDIKYVQINDKLYIDRNTYEEAQKKQINIDGNPLIINNKNYYKITNEQLEELNNSKNKTTSITNTNTNKSNKKYITIYNDKITNKKYIKETDLGYKKENPKTIMNNTCYEISDEEINKLNKRIVNISIYLKQKKTLKVPIASIDNKLYIPSEYTSNSNSKKIKIDGVIYNEVSKDYLAILKQQLNNKDTELVLIKKSIVKKNTTSNDLIPGTNIPRPRNRGLYETDEEYEQFLKEYYDKAFNKNKELNDMFINNNTDTKEKNK